MTIPYHADSLGQAALRGEDASPVPATLVALPCPASNPQFTDILAES